MAKTKQIRKNTKEYQKLDLEQSKLKSELHQNIRDYRKWKHGHPTGSEAKAPVTTSQLEKQEAKINDIRKQLNKRQITLIEDLKSTLVHLK